GIYSSFMQLAEMISYSSIPGCTRLFLDYLSQSAALAEFYQSYPNDKAFSSLSQKLQSINYPRQELVEILSTQNQQYGASQLTFEKIKLLAKSETVAVVTGQQVGLFGGPLYTVYKTITAIQFARLLTEQYSIPAIPVFWMAADDDDFAEINHISIIDKSNQATKLEYTPTSPVSNKSPSGILFDEKINEVMIQLESGLFDTEFKPLIFDTLRECYQPGTSFSTAFGKWMTKLFGKYGLVLLDPTDARFRKLAGSLYKKEILEQAKSKEIIKETTKSVCDKGYHQQVAIQDDKTHLFIDYAGSRYPIRKEAGRFLFSGTNMRYTADELIELIDQTPEQFSPNVLLRPIFEDAIIPTIAYIPGPNELAYYAQIKKAYAFFGVQMPILIPRIGATIIEKKIDELLNKYQIPLESLIRNSEKAVSDALKQSIPQEITAELDQMKQLIDSQYQLLQEKITQWDQSLKEAIASSKNSVLHQVNSLGNKIGLAHKKKNDTIRDQLNKLVNHLLPNRNLQERSLNIIPYLVKYNFEFIDNLYSVVDFKNSKHQIIKIS
ncbi:MAG: bacillithiol biosynthesis cysteine-adding enzyme BshC, partial [bacterium]